jgi:hypothetical protein
VIACPNCRTIQSPAMINSGELFSCPTCHTRMRADLFNAFYRTEDSTVGRGYIQGQGQAECFNHPGRPAKVPCAQCGRLLCELCEVELEGRSLCFSCVKAGRDSRQEVRLETQRVLHDSIALTLALIPVLFIFPTILTAPAAIYVAIRYWKRRPMIIPRSRWRYVVAMILALMQIIGWVLFFVKSFT